MANRMPAYSGWSALLRNSKEKSVGMFWVSMGKTFRMGLSSPPSLAACGFANAKRNKVFASHESKSSLP